MRQENEIAAAGGLTRGRCPGEIVVATDKGKGGGKKD
jgi:hypothetical protein